MGQLEVIPLADQEAQRPLEVALGLGRMRETAGQQIAGRLELVVAVVLVPAAGQGVELPWGLRTVDGSCNNLLPGKEYFGTAGKPFPTLVGPVKASAETGDPDGPGPAPFGPTWDPLAAGRPEAVVY